MATIKKTVKKAQSGGNFGDMYTGPSETHPGVLKAKADKAKADINIKKYKAKADSVKLEAIKKVRNKGKMKMGGTVKAKNGGSFPDLNKDGKITKADILKGRGVIAKKGAAISKMKSGGKCKNGC